MSHISFSWPAKLLLLVAVLSWSALPSEAAKGGGGGGGGRGGSGGGGGRGGSAGSFSRGTSTSGNWGHNGTHNNGHQHHGSGFGYWPGFGYGYYYPGYGYSTQPIYRSSYYGGDYQEESEPVGESATIILKVPADAEVWFNDIKTKQTGKERKFVSPPLMPGYSYQYQIRASWMVDGKMVSQTRDVSIRPGQNAVVEIRGPAPGQP